MAREYKDSGIEWIGQIPKEWEQYRIKYNTFLKGRIGWQGLNSSDFLNEGYCLITGTDFDNKGGINWNSCYRISEERYNEDELLHVKKGDLLMTKDGTVGKMAFIKELPEEASLNSHLLIIRQLTKLIDNSFLYWVMLSDVFKGFSSFYQSGTIMSSISQGTLGFFACYCPPLSEQHKIADYLDKLCGEVDEMVALQETMIEELKAYKQSVITEAVTKGLNPNVPMRNSGIDWIGEIPEGWEVKRLKYVSNISRGLFNHRPRNDERYYGGIYPFIQTGDVARSKKYIESYSQTLSDLGVSVSKLFPKGTLTMTIAANVGDVSILGFNAYFPDSVLGIIPLPDVDNIFLYYALKAMKGEFVNAAIVSTQLNLNVERVYNMKTVVPPISEQRAIASYLDTKCSEIDSLIALKQAKIEELKEYKKSVIYEYVTGKKEVV